MRRLQKVLGAVLTAVVIGTMTFSTVFAAPSPESGGVISGVSTATDENGNPVTVTLGAMSTVDPAIVADAQDVETIQSVLGSDYEEGMQTIDVREVTVPAGTVFPITITFTNSTLNAQCTGFFMHWTGNAWEKISARFGTGTMTGTFSSLSPVAFVVKYNTTSGGNTNNGNTNNGNTNSGSTSNSTTSPKTGEASMVIPVAVATAAIVTLTAVNRKKKEVK